MEAYYIDQRPPGLIFGNQDLFNPRLSLFLDTHFGKHFYSFVQARFDRGFEPGARRNGDARFDEYLLHYMPFDDARLNIQVGKFATLAGNWVPRHDSWNNPFIKAPVHYENVFIMTDHAAPKAPQGFLDRRRRPDKKDLWLSTLMGPSYASDASVFGLWRTFDYAAEVKNSSVSSHHQSWDGTDVNWQNPTVRARLGYRPNAAWAAASRSAKALICCPTRVRRCHPAKTCVITNNSPSTMTSVTLGTIGSSGVKYLRRASKCPP